MKCKKIKKIALVGLCLYQLQCRQLLGHMVDLSVALLAHIIHLLKTHCKNMGKDCSGSGGGRFLKHFASFIGTVSLFTQLGAF